MARDNTWHIATAFAAGAAAGAAAGVYWMRRYHQIEQQQQKQPPSLDLRALQRTSSSLGSPTPSTAGSVCYSLPPTPRFNGMPSFGRSESFGPSSSGGGADEAGKPRMVFVVRRDLGWGKQKLAVMTAHVALGLFKKLYKSRSPLLPQWEAAKGPKLVLRADDEAGLLGVMEAAREQGLPCHSIAEATGNPDCPRTRSILAIGPLSGEQLSSISSGLVLL